MKEGQSRFLVSKATMRRRAIFSERTESISAGRKFNLSRFALGRLRVVVADALYNLCIMCYLHTDAMELCSHKHKVIVKKCLH